MSRLRDNLQTARSEYEKIRYPGVLSRDVRARVVESKQTIGYIGRALRVTIALAAVLAIAIVGWRMSQPKNVEVGKDESIATNDEATAAATDETVPSFASISVPSWSDVTEVASISTKDQPSQTTSWPSMPSFPSIDSIDATSATKSLNSSKSFDEEMQ